MDVLPHPVVAEFYRLLVVDHVVGGKTGLRCGEGNDRNNFVQHTLYEVIRGDDVLKYDIGDVSDNVNALAGNDLIYTYAGDDLIYAGEGNDLIS